METHEIQQLFFNYIKSKIAPHLSFVDEIAALLKISHDSAYRRIRGEKEIGLADVKALCNQYKISLDQLLQIQSGTFIFSGDFIDSTSFGLNTYLQQINKNLQFLTSLQNPHLYYFNKDIPPPFIGCSFPN
jgi:predicted transcriptional regulator